LLHDAVEDQGGLPTMSMINREFGPKVGSIVWACTDAVEIPKPPWLGRKKAHFAHIATCDEQSLLVMVADKVHNAQSLLNDFETLGDEMWEAFQEGMYGAVWYLKNMHDGLSARIQGPLVDRLATLVDRLADLLSRSEHDALYAGVDPPVPS